MIGTASRGLRACSRIPGRCAGAGRRSATRDVERARLVEDLLGDGDLADVVEERRDADAVDLGLGQLELAAIVDDDRGDQRGRLAAVVGQRGDDRSERVGRGSRARWPISTAGPARGGDRGTRDPRIVVGLLEHVGLVAAERLGRVHRRVGVTDEVLHPELAADPARDADRDRDRDVGRPRPRSAAADERPQLLRQHRPFLDVGLGQDEHEFLAAVAADHVDAARFRRSSGRRRAGPRRPTAWP
jgi:hypothetical protein